MQRTWAALAILPVLAVSACGQQETNPADPAAAPTAAHSAGLAGGNAYVALGDSFASMASMANLDDSNPVAAFCMRSADNYPHLVAEQLGLDLTDVTCQGATSADTLAAHEIDGGLVHGQVDSLTEDTALVTLTIGGNDAIFGSPSGCDPRDNSFTDGEGDGATPDPNAAPADPSSPSAADAAAQEAACIADARAANDVSIEDLPVKLDEVYTAIRQRAPQATIVTTGYLPVILASDTCDYATSLSQADLDWFQETTDKLNSVVAQSAADHGALFVMPDDADAHTACASATDRWTSVNGEETDSFPMHPTASGQAAVADAVVSALQTGTA